MSGNPHMTPIERLTLWAECRPEAADLPAEYPCTVQGRDDVLAVIADGRRARETIYANEVGDWRKMVL